MSETPKHSPTPWRVDQDAGPIAVLDIDDVLDSEGRPVAHVPSKRRNDALLIAAAPELLAALQSIVNGHVKHSYDSVSGEYYCSFCGRQVQGWESCDSDDCAYVVSRAAIAKATGGNGGAS